MLPTKKQTEAGDVTEEQVRWSLEVGAWSEAIIGAEPRDDTILPWLELDSAFIGDGAGKYVKVREEMEEKHMRHEEEYRQDQRKGKHRHTGVIRAIKTVPKMLFEDSGLWRNNGNRY